MFIYYKSKVFLFVVLCLLCLSNVNANESIDESFSNENIDYLFDDTIENEFIIMNSQNSNLYVDANHGNDNNNGSEYYPFESLEKAISVAENGSNIYLYDGVYSGSKNSNLPIFDSLKIVGLSNNVILDGGNNNYFFKIDSNCVFELDNLIFTNGYSSLYSQESIFLNEGTLIINNSVFNNMNSFLSTILNKGVLKIYNSNFSNCFSDNYGSLVSNVGESYFYNSLLLGSIYNCGNISFYNSKLNSFDSDYQFNNGIKNGDNYIKADYLEIEYFNVYNVDNIVLNNSILKAAAVITYSNISIFNSKCSLDVYECNISGYNSSFNNIKAPNSFLNISHSIIYYFYTNFYSYGNMNYNWWGDNKGPQFSFPNIDAKYWIVMVFNCNENPIYVGTNADFIVSLAKYTDGNNLFDLTDTSFLNYLKVFLEAESGYFLNNGEYLNNGILISNLIDNTEEIMVYATVDNQKLRLAIGNGSSNYNWFVSNDGHNGFGDGSEENPFKTLEFALSKSLTGNTIYILNGTYKYEWNANLIINKNVTFVGLGNVTLIRPDNLNFFIVYEWGVLNLFNINFTVNSKYYINPLIVLNGGIVNIYNSNFYDITTSGTINNWNYHYSIIQSTADKESNGILNIFNTSFINIAGSSIRGSAEVNIYDSLFSENSRYYGNNEDKFYCINSESNITIVGTVFYKNDIGGIYFTSSNSNDVIKIINSSFIENYWYRNINGVTNDGVSGLSGISSNPYSIIDGCYFYANEGSSPNVKFVSANEIINSIFINNNKAVSYADFVFNSTFINNDNFIYYNGAYVGSGILSADTILNSSFINNHAAMGGALFNVKNVHYSVFIDNSAYYWGNDIYTVDSYVLNCSSNWWGFNQKPDNDRIFVFDGTLIIDNWIIMTLELGGNMVIASLNNLVDNDLNIVPLNFVIPSRIANFSTDFGELSQNIVNLSNNKAITYIIFNETSNDFNIYATIDYQTLDLSIFNNNTQILIDNISFYGNDNQYNISLINVNGHRIFNQTLLVNIYKNNNLFESFTLLTDEYGNTNFKIDYPIGEYTINVFYGGNGYFNSCNNTSIISVLSSITHMNSINYTFYGKNNKFYATLTDVTGKRLVNQSITFKITDFKGKSNNVNTFTNSYGRAEILLDLDTGEYTIDCIFDGDNWYGFSSSKSIVFVLPVNSTIYVPNVTLYGVGNLYSIILKDSLGKVIVGENVKITISQGNDSSIFDVLTDNDGIASITINLLPGKYDISVLFVGDNVYGSASGKAILIVEKVFTILSSYFYTIIPVGGYYSVVLTDMHGRRIAGENISLNIYKGHLIKSLYGVTDGFGEVNFKIDLTEGNYFVIIEYNGNIWYIESSEAATIVVSNDIDLVEVSINGTDFVQCYGENRYFVISFDDPNAFSLYGKTILVTISSSTWSQSYEILTDVYGFARLQITLNPGTYNITYSYKNTFYNLYASGFNSIIVYRMPVSILTSDMIINKGEARYYDLKLIDINGNPIKNMIISVNISGIFYNITTNADGLARLMISLDPGEYDVSYSFSNVNYLSSNGSSKILVVDSDKASTILTGEDVSGLDGETLNFTVILSGLLGNGINAATVYLDITTTDGTFIKTLHAITNSNGEVVFKLDLDFGSYIFKSYYNGNNQQLASYATNYVIVNVSANQIKTIIRGQDTVLNYSDSNSKFFITLTDAEGNLLINKEITFTIGNNNYKVLTDSSGRAYLDVLLNTSIYKVFVSFAGEGNYTKATETYLVSISSGLIIIKGEDLTLYYRNGSQYIIQLTDNDGNAIAFKNITFNINGNNYTKTTDKDGFARITINLDPKVYDILTIFDDGESNTFKKSKITVLPTLDSADLTKYFRNASQFEIKLLDNKGNIIKNTDVTMNINGVMYTRTTNDQGIATLSINLIPGKYVLTAEDPNNGLKVSYTINVLSVIEAYNLEKYHRNDSQYHVKILDSKGNPIANTDVKMNINGVMYIRKTNDEGIATLSINLDPGNYVITVYHPNNDQTYSNTIKVLPTLFGNDLTLNNKDGSSYAVKLIDGIGKPIANKNITFNINGVFYNRLTDVNGIAKLTINLDPNHYIITSTYNGYSTSNSIVVNKL